MYCQKCGSKVKEGKKYCGQCGEPVRRNNGKMIAIVVAGILMAIGLGICIWCLLDKDGKAENTQQKEDGNLEVKKEDIEAAEEQENLELEYVFDAMSLDEKGIRAIDENEAKLIMKSNLYGEWSGLFLDTLRNKVVIDENMLGSKEYDLYTIYEVNDCGYFIYFKMKDSDSVYLIQTDGKEVNEGKLAAKSQGLDFLTEGCKEIGSIALTRNDSFESNSEEEDETKDKKSTSAYVFDAYSLDGKNGLTAIEEGNSHELLCEYLYGTWSGVVGDNYKPVDSFVIDEVTFGGSEYSLYSLYESEKYGVLVFYVDKDWDEKVVFMAQTDGINLVDGDSFVGQNDEWNGCFDECKSMFLYLQRSDENLLDTTNCTEDHFGEAYQYATANFKEAINNNLSVTDQIALAAGVKITYQDAETVLYDYYGDEYGNTIYSFTFQVIFDEYGLGLNVMRKNVSATVIETSDGSFTLDYLYIVN